jgi:hypothetical protein
MQKVNCRWNLCRYPTVPVTTAVTGALAFLVRVSYLSASLGIGLLPLQVGNTPRPRTCVAKKVKHSPTAHQTH